MSRQAIKQAIPPGLKTIMRYGLVSPLRAYFRYAPGTFAKDLMWNSVVSHLCWLESTVTSSTVFGRRLAADAADPVGKYIYYFGVWEPNLTRWLQEQLRAGDVFVDVGANVGYYSLLASSLVGPAGRVVSIEALPQFFGLLKENIAINRADNIRPIQAAAWDREETVRLFLRPDHPTGTTTAMPEWADRYHLEDVCEVPGLPLATLLQPDEMAAARVIKIDVEGAEWRVVKGLGDLIRSSRPDIEFVVEVTSGMDKAEGASAEDVVSFFRELGFHPYQIENNYSAEAYYGNHSVGRPTRLDTAARIEVQADIIFSRRDTMHL